MESTIKLDPKKDREALISKLEDARKKAKENKEYAEKTGGWKLLHPEANTIIHIIETKLGFQDKVPKNPSKIETKNIIKKVKRGNCNYEERIDAVKKLDPKDKEQGKLLAKMAKDWEQCPITSVQILAIKKLDPKKHEFTLYCLLEDAKRKRRKGDFFPSYPEADDIISIIEIKLGI